MRYTLFISSLLIFYQLELCFSKHEKRHNTKNKLKILDNIKVIKLEKVHDLGIIGFLLTPVIITTEIKSSSPNVEEFGEEVLDGRIKAYKPIPSNIISTENEKNDIEINFRQALDKGSPSKKVLSQTKVNETLLQNILMDTTRTTTTTKTKVTNIVSENNNINVADVMTSTERMETSYPNAVYNNTLIESIILSNIEPNNNLLPPKINEDWRNFRTGSNIVSKENTSEIPFNATAVTEYPSVNEIDSIIKGVYPAAVYNNTEIDQLSITTNSHTNESPLPSHNDRWNSFSSIKKMLQTSNEFKPLAGLYYDGFLHKPLPKGSGFVPYYNQYNYYS